MAICIKCYYVSLQNNPPSTTSSTVGSVTTAVSGSGMLPPNGVLTSAQTLGQIKGFPISINHLQAAQQQGNTRTSLPSVKITKLCLFIKKRRALSIVKDIGE